jgi:hypothetical protein
VIATFVSGMQFSGRIGSYVGSGLNATEHGRNILFEAYEMLAAEQDCRAAALPGLDHQNLVQIYQDLSCRRPRSCQWDKNSQTGLPPFGWRCRKRLEPLIACDKTQRPQLFAVQIDFYNREDQEKRNCSIQKGWGNRPGCILAHKSSIACTPLK